METMTVGHFKANFSEVLEKVKHGEDIIISYGKKKEKIAVLVPFDRYEDKAPRVLGLLAGKASFSISPGFKISDDELLSS
jgi:prevent-host-death family protein